MARRRRKYYYYAGGRQRGDDPRFEPIGLDLAPETKRGIAIIGFMLAAVISALGILDLAGNFGQLITKVLRLLFGSAAYIAPFIFFAVALSLFLGTRLHRGKEGEQTVPTSLLRTYLGSGLFVLAITGILHLFAIRSGTATPFELVKAGEGGGYLGIFTSFPLFTLMGFAASLAVLIALLIVSFLVAFDISLHGVLRAFLFIFGSGRDKQEQSSKSLAAGAIKINTMENSGFSVSSLKQKKEPPEAETLDEEMEEEKEFGEFEERREAAIPEELRATTSITPSKFRKEDWKLPSTDLLEENLMDVKSGNIEANVKIIKKTLEDFGVTVDMGEVNVGPTVTQYTFRPAVGVKLAQILSLQDDLALALAAPSIRVEAPIPGRSLVGIEVPNQTPSIVSLRGLLESEAFQKHPSNLAFVLGRDVAGHPMIADLEKMPHLLVAGATGSGKTVCLNSILTSFLYRNSPQELRIVIIDPKRVDLTLYSGIPHLLTPVITDHKQAVNALKWSLAEMDRRYSILSETNKRNIQEFNQSTTTPMPFIVIVVDELAQLMALAKNDVETAIVRLAQMARAVGVHLILATQRPSVDVITGLIKANITSRIAFMVASQVDSRTILDMAGAESLLGRGDMLYSTSELPLPKRIQSSYISGKNLRRVLDFLTAQSGPVRYQEEILSKPQRSSSNSFGDEDEMDDDMLNAAIEEIRRARKASASLLQRRLKVGYARAARILDILEERGMIGPSDGAKPREIYMEEEENYRD